MVEAQARNTRPRAVDGFLQSLVSIVNDESASIPITLSVGGLLVSGDLIGGKAYFNEFARQFKDGFRDISSETAATIEESFKRLGDVGDAATADRLLADDYFFMTRDGVVHENLKAALLVRMKSGQSKADLLASLNSAESDDPQPTIIDDAQVHVHGDTGVVIVRSLYKSRGKDGRVVEVPTRFMHVWARQQGRWRLVAGSSTRIEQPKP